MDRKAGDIAISFLAFKNIVKIYHFQTPSYARHKSSDMLFNTLTEKIDKFMEVLQGAWRVRINLGNGKEIPLGNTDDNTMISILEEFSAWLLEDIPKLLRPQDKDLLNIRDEILGAVSQTLYLFTFE